MFDDKQIKRKRTTITHMSLELSYDEVQQLVLGWAKNKGFSHRAKIKIDEHGVVIEEEVIR